MTSVQLFSIINQAIQNCFQILVRMELRLANNTYSMFALFLGGVMLTVFISILAVILRK